ncbi:dephospho-CoA kinase [Patescibacteria group bacterium]|nr:dephospho-CoA kinase [Patescibacteria group bacterium]MBU1015958.1 dephospho-CoA kinase [Patescibacteria group bacterium]MBU1685306.1 dephospho-CoA kinase [Patescibacteria group bacterium]MBU1939093.1 dephospho-CoA kinase [Patescibacteria group bacterium]
MIIGLTGPMASGKSTVVDALKSQGFRHFTLSDIVREECTKRGLEEVRDNLMATGQSLRKEFGAGVLAVRALQKTDENSNWIIDGIRNPAEVDELRKHPHFILIANTAPEDMIVSRILSRKRSDDTMDETAIRTKLRREMGEGEPPEGQQLKKCIDMADYVFENVMPIDQVETEFMKLYNQINDAQKT